MFEAIKSWWQDQVEERRRTDFGAITCLKDADERNRAAHDDLMAELSHLHGLLNGTDRRVGGRRRTDH